MVKLSVVLNKYQSKGFHRIGWIAIAAVLFQILLPLIHHPALASNVEQQVMCPMHGSMPSTTGETGKSPLTKSPSCPICQSLHVLNGGYVPPDAMTLATPNDVSPFYHSPVSSFAQRHFLVVGQPRAPPSFV
jgi:hypothetical protein